MCVFFVISLDIGLLNIFILLGIFLMLVMCVEFSSNLFSIWCCYWVLSARLYLHCYCYFIQLGCHSVSEKKHICRPIYTFVNVKYSGISSGFCLYLHSFILEFTSDLSCNRYLCTESLNSRINIIHGNPVSRYCQQFVFSTTILSSFLDSCNPMHTECCKRAVILLIIMFIM